MRYNGVSASSVLRERAFTFGGTKDKEWPPKGASEKQSETDASSEDSRRGKIEKIEEKEKGR